MPKSCNFSVEAGVYKALRRVDSCFQRNDTLRPKRAFSTNCLKIFSYSLEGFTQVDIWMIGAAIKNGGDIPS
jgi:hypothetical protein